MAFLDVFKKEKNPNSPSKAGNASEGSISADVIPFLNIIAKNSLALPGMARDMNVLRQNIVKLVKLKNAEAITKADKFFKTEDQRESELEEARKKETSPKPEKESKSKKEKVGKEEEGILGVLWDVVKTILLGLFLGIANSFAKVFDLGKLISEIADKLNPMPLIEGLFKTLKEGWQKITESDIVKETLIKGFGKFLSFITAGLFGEKELRQSLDDLSTYLKPMIDVLGETFDTVVAWLRDNIGWDSFTIPLSKATDFLPEWAKSRFSLPDIPIPGFRPFKNAGKKENKPSGGAASSGGAPPAATSPAPAASESGAKPSEMMPVSAKTSSLEVPLPAGGDKKKNALLSDVFSSGSDNPSEMFSNLMSLKEKYKGVEGGPAPEDKSGYMARYGTPPSGSSKTEEYSPPTTPTPAKPPSAPVASPSPAASSGSDTPEVEKHRKLAKGFSIGNASSVEGIDQEISYVKTKRDYYLANRDRASEIADIQKYREYDKIVEIYEARLSELKNMKKGFKDSATGGAVSAGTATSPTSVAPSTGGGASPGGGGGSMAPSPSPAPSSPASSGASLSTASAEVAEGQRMDSAANAGVYVDAGTVNNGSSTTGKPAKQTASAYNTEFIKSYST